MDSHPRNANGIKAFRSLTIATDGVATVNTWRLDPWPLLLTQLQLAVGGYVEVVALSPTLTMWVNDEGVYRLPLNPWAGLVAGHYRGLHEDIFGTVVFTGGTTADGDTLPLGDRQLAEFAPLLAQASGAVALR